MFTKTLFHLMPIVYPKFYTLHTEKGEELVLLCEGEKLHEVSIIEDKTQFEAVNNHVHLFEKVGEADKIYAKDIGIQIANNLIKELTTCFPDKCFIVFLDLNIHDSVIIRFHQHWPDEPVYYNVNDFCNILEFRNC